MAGLSLVLGTVLGFIAALLTHLSSSLVERWTILLGSAWIAAGVIVGGRLGWWLFYHRSDGVPGHWFDILAIWNGGMSFHGGLIGVVAAMGLWCRRHRIPFWNVADAAAVVAPVGLFFGRIANFINAELVGRPTEVSWAVIFPGDSFGRHPSQLYEAVLEGPLLLMLLLLLRRRRPQEGMLSAAFLVGYGLVRFLVEFTREPDPQLGFLAFGWLTMGQLLSITILAIGTLMPLIVRPLTLETQLAAK